MLKVFFRHLKTGITSTLLGLPHIFKLSGASRTYTAAATSVSLIIPYKKYCEKNSTEDKPDDHGGLAIDPPRPIRFLGKMACKCVMTYL